MKKSVFENNGEDFFKSTELNPEGKLLQKSIPSMPDSGMKMNPVQTKKKVPKEIVKYVEKCEETLKGLDEKIKEIITSDKLSMYNQDEAIKMIAAYKTFKYCFTRCTNQIINYPEIRDIKSKEKTDWDKTRINL